MFKWFKTLFQNPPEFTKVTLEDTPSKKDTSGPKITDFPRSKYSVYWEVVNEESKEHGYKATVRFYSYMGGVVDELVFVSRSKEDLKKQVHRAIPGKMNKHRKGM